MTLSCPPYWFSAEMGVCVVDQCLTNSMVGKGTRLYRIPKVRAQYGEYELELSQRRRNGFLAAIGRKDSASLHNARICSLHFIKGKPAQSLYSELDPDWLPSLNLPGICKKSPTLNGSLGTRKDGAQPTK